MNNLLASGWVTWVILGVAVAAFVLMYFLRSRSYKKQQEEATKKLNQIVPGTKIMTIGGIYGTIIEVEETYIVIETGSGENKSFIKLDKRGIGQIISEPTSEVSDQAVPSDEVFSEVAKAEEEEVSEEVEETLEESEEDAE